MPRVKKTLEPIHYFSFQINAGHFEHIYYPLDVRDFPTIDRKMEIIRRLIEESVVITGWQVNQIVITGGILPLLYFAVTVSYTGEKLDQQRILQKISETRG